jgi:O-antigen/teichoic acid export membrane protein
MGKGGENITSFQMSIVGVSIVITTINAYLQRVLIGQDHFGLINKLSIVSGILVPFLLILMVAVLKLRVDGSIIANMLNQVFWLVAFMIFILRKYPVRPRIHFDLIKQSYSYGVRAWFGDIATQANVRFDQFLLGANGNRRDLGLYTMSVNLSELLWILPDAIGNVLFNKVAGSKDDMKSAILTARIHRVVFFMRPAAAAGVPVETPSPRHHCTTHRCYPNPVCC